MHNNFVLLILFICLGTTARDTKSFAFQAIGLLAKRMPQLFRWMGYFLPLYHTSLSLSLYVCVCLDISPHIGEKPTFYSLREKIDMAVRLFDSMKLESQSIRFTIQEATNSLSAAYKVEQPEINVPFVVREFNDSFCFLDYYGFFCCFNFLLLHI